MALLLKNKFYQSKTINKTVISEEFLQSIINELITNCKRGYYLYGTSGSGDTEKKIIIELYCNLLFKNKTKTIENKPQNEK